MTHDIAQIITKYKGQTMDTIMTHPDIERDIATIGQSINDNNPNATQAKEFLEHLLTAIKDKIGNIEHIMQTEKGSADHVKKMSDACVAYLRPRDK